MVYNSRKAYYTEILIAVFLVPDGATKKHSVIPFRLRPHGAAAAKFGKIFLLSALPRNAREAAKGACKFFGPGKEVKPMRRLFFVFLTFLAAWSGWLLFCFQRARRRCNKKGPKNPPADTDTEQED